MKIVPDIIVKKVLMKKLKKLQWKLPPYHTQNVKSHTGLSLRMVQLNSAKMVPIFASQLFSYASPNKNRETVSSPKHPIFQIAKVFPIELILGVPFSAKTPIVAQQPARVSPFIKFLE